MKNHLRRRLAVLLAFGLLLASCGSDDDVADTTADDAAVEAEATGETAPDETNVGDEPEATDEPTEGEPTEEPAATEDDEGSEGNAEESAAEAIEAAGAPIVLVHGAWQDGSSWAQVQQALEADGHQVSAVTLPGRDGVDAGAQTLDGYRDVVIAEIETYDEPVILVGHSFGGLTISNVAEAIPEQVASLVYVAAYLPADGDSLSGLAAQDAESVLGQEGNLVLEGEPTLASVPDDLFAPFFCPDCDEAQAATVAASAVAEPAGPLLMPVALSAENFGSVPKAYVQTALDIVVGPSLQEAMFTAAGVEEVFVLETGHAPYVTAPDALAALIVG